MLSIFKCKISDIKYIHLVGQPSPPASPELTHLPELKLASINFHPSLSSSSSTPDHHPSTFFF